ncbi:MAG: diphthamide biosynthesis enzyme Dph2 [Thermoplasmata archaeon]
MSVMRSYIYDTAKLKEWILREKIKKFGVQLPAGILPQASEILEELSVYGEPVLYAEPSFGACDFPEISTLSEVDGLVQLGHAKIPGLATTQKILFLELYSRAEPMPPTGLPGEMGEQICLFTTVQYVKQLQKIATFFEAESKKVHIPEPRNRTIHLGQVLGCDVSAAAACSDTVDSYIFVGDGIFHPMGIAMLTSKPVYRYHLSGRIELIKFDREKFLKAGIGKSFAVQDAKKIGIVVCTKPGQKRIQLAKHLEKILKRHNKATRMLWLNTLTPEILNYTGFDVLISTACPRIALEDYGNYKVTLLTPQEALLGLKEIKNYEIDQFLPEHI